MNYEEEQKRIQMTGAEHMPLEDGVLPLDPSNPSGLCRTYDGSLSPKASNERPRNRAVANHGKEKDKRMALQMANASMRSLMAAYESEVVASRCVFSSDVDTQESLPRKCSRGYFDGTPIFQDCMGCKNFTLGPEIIEIEDLWPDSAFTNLLKKKRELVYPMAKHPQDRPGGNGWVHKQASLVDRKGEKTGGCSKCQQKKHPKRLPQGSTGLGTTLERFFGLLGIKSCEKCKARRDKLNRIFPYGKNRHTKSN
tara:strand:- start:550 stop:1308 length:759 start_codon:yes stop_codon:yes gene_type:complete